MAKHAPTNKTRRYPPRSASWIEEMENRSRRRTRDLVTQAASQGLSENEIGCARISMMARSTNAPCKGRIQMRKTNRLQIIKSSLQRTGGPVSCAVAYKSPQSPTSSILRQSAFCMKNGADEFVLATNARRTHELTAQPIGAPQDGPRR